MFKRSWVLVVVLLAVALMLVAVPGSAGTPTCNGLAATIVGTSGDDVLQGTSGVDVIAAGAGNDVVDGKGGDDIICGDAGDDELNGGKGDDLLLGGSGHDILSGNGGSDTVNGGKGIDLCRQGTKKKCERKGNIERDFFELVNETRADRCAGEDALRRHSKYDWMAGVHSWDMAVHDFLSHTSPTYGGFETRVATFELPGSMHAENIAWLLNEVTAGRFFDEFWASDPHREHICDPDWELTGIGVIVSGGQGWVTQVFGA